MLNTTRVPVKVYRWDDEGAPQIGYGKGAVKRILKACLSEGYGVDRSRKEPLGWEMMFEEGDSAIFKIPSPTANGWALSVSNSSGNHIAVDALMLRNPTGLNSGQEVAGSKTIPFEYEVKQIKTVEWYLVGCERGFWLGLLDEEKNNRCGFLYFGEFTSLLAYDVGNVVMGASVYGRVLSGDNASWVCACEYTGTGYLKSVSEVSKFAGMKTFVGYPSPIFGGFSADDVWISEGGFLRGCIPGFVNVLENLKTGYKYFSTIEKLNEHGDDFMFFRAGYYQNSLINISAWEY